VKPHDTAENVTAPLSKTLPQESESSTIEEGNKNGLGGATNTKTLGLATSLDPTKNDKEMTTAMVPQKTWATEDSDFAIFFLETAQRDYEHALFMRTYYAKNARKHGITNKRIGEIYGVTEGAIRKMLKQAGDS
jgi:hypothetical protein